MPTVVEFDARLLVAAAVKRAHVSAPSDVGGGQQPLQLWRLSPQLHHPPAEAVPAPAAERAAHQAAPRRAS